MTEQEIISGCIRQNKHCQRILFDQYAGKFMTLCLRYANNQMEAEDMMQEGFIAIFKHIEQYKNNGAFGGWMRKIMVNAALNILRKNKLHIVDIDDATTYQPSVDAYSYANMGEEDLMKLINALPKGYRVVFNLSVFEGYSHDEIGKILDIQPATSRSQLVKARKMLQQQIIELEKNCCVMTNKLFDSFVNDKLKDYESPVPDGLWEKIIAKDEKPKIAFWWNRKIWMLGFAVFIFISGFGYLTLNKTNKSKEIIAYKQLQTQNFKGTDFSGLAVSSSNTIPASKIDEQNNIQENLKQSRKLNNETAENKTEKTRVEPLDGNKHKVLNQDVVTDFKTTLSSIKSAKNRSSLKRKATINQTFLGKQQSIIQNLKVGSGLDANFLNDESYTTHLSRENGAVLMRASDLENTNLLKEKQVLALGKLFSGVDDCPTTRGTYRNDIYLEAYVSPDIAFKNVASTKLGNDSYLQKKDSSESMRLGFTIGARFSKSITNNLLFKAGLQYSQMSERFTLRTENDRRQTIVINSHTIVRPNLPDTTISDTSVSVQIGYRIRTNMNYYRNLEIPLILSYEFGQSDESKWKIAVNAGAIVNITSWYDGKTIDAGYNLVNIGSKANNGFYKSQFGVSLYGGLSVIRSISPQLDVFAEPYFRYGLYNMQGSAGFNQRFNIAGIQVGTRLKISTHKHL